MHIANRIVGQKSLPLRQIEVTFANGWKEMGILDDGSSIIVMRKDLWQGLGVPLIQDESITMECADASLNQTMGLVRNVPVTI